MIGVTSVLQLLTMLYWVGSTIAKNANPNPKKTKTKKKLLFSHQQAAAGLNHSLSFHHFSF